MSDHRFYEAPSNGAAYGFRAGNKTHPLHILMLHGWSGDERVMWVLESVLPEQAPVASLRGVFPLERNGYQWTHQAASIDTKAADFSGAIEAVQWTLERLTEKHGFDPERLVLMGFSQGAALSFALAENLDHSPRAIVALAGYRPIGSNDLVKDVPIFWGHGTQDVLVPIERARDDVSKLERLGAKVNYCEADVGHKLGIECTRGLKHWFETLITSRDP